MLGEPGRTNYDLLFQVFGFPVRISAWFWLAALLLGRNATEIAGSNGIFVWILAMLLSILIHELGHTFAFRYFGIPSHIVLYHFGGLAIPGGNSPWASPGQYRRTPRSDLVISAAGPAAQLLAALLMCILIRASGRAVPLSIMASLPGLDGGGLWSNKTLFYFCFFFLLVSVYWAFLNLVPVYPLDGGQIARNLFLMFGNHNAIQYSLWLSVICGAAVALYGLQRQEPFLGIMFAMLAYSSYQQVSGYGGYGRRW